MHVLGVVRDILLNESVLSRQLLLFLVQVFLVVVDFGLDIEETVATLLLGASTTTAGAFLLVFVVLILILIIVVVLVVFFLILFVAATVFVVIIILSERIYGWSLSAMLNPWLVVPIVAVGAKSLRLLILALNVEIVLHDGRAALFKVVEGPWRETNACHLCVGAGWVLNDCRAVETEEREPDGCSKGSK